jgi:hypothetical protein
MSSNIIFPAVFLKAGNLPERLPLRSPQVPARKTHKTRKNMGENKQEGAASMKDSLQFST